MNIFFFSHLKLDIHLESVIVFVVLYNLTDFSVTDSRNTLAKPRIDAFKFLISTAKLLYKEIV